MRTIRFLSRVAFICNLFFLLAFSLQLVNWINQPDITGTILITGFFFAALFNPLVNLCILILFLFRKKPSLHVPAWLITANLMFLLLQFFYILYLNDQQPR
jgi:hypothetical protein